MTIAVPAPSTELPRVAPCHRRAVERVIAAMNARLDQRFTLRDMASIAYLSPYHFHRIFRQATGVPPGRFLAALRIDAAKRLLLSSDLSVTEISLAVGYHSLSTFSAHFSHLVGLSPRAFRKLGRRSEVTAVPPTDEACDSTSTVTGSLTVEGEFTGLAFVGLFKTPLPQGRPIACAVARAPGPYQLTTEAEGEFYVLVAALPYAADAVSYLAPDGEVLTGRSDGPVVLRTGGVTKAVDLALTPRLPTEPPILIAPVPLVAAMGVEAGLRKGSRRTAMSEKAAKIGSASIAHRQEP